jgi:glycosyltransferase involved in cell wall biosynthesis
MKGHPQRMKVAMVVPGGVDRSGEYRVVPALLALLGRLTRHHEVHVFALAHEPTDGTWQLAGATIHNVGARATVVRAVQSVLREHRVAPFALVHSMWAGRSGLVATVAARRLGIPSLVHVAGGELVAFPDIGYGGRLRWRGRLLALFVLRGATLVTAASEPLIAAIAMQGVRAQRVPLGVDLDSWPPREPVRRRQAAGTARLIHVANLNRVKDQATLLQALAMLDAAGLEFHLDVVGEDTLSGHVQAMATGLRLAARTTFHGFLPQRRLRPLMEAAHVHVISSRHEAGPLVVLEAAVAGVPTAGTSVGHIAEWAPAAALSAPPGRPAELAAAIRRLLEDEDLRLRIANEALQRARAEDADFTARQFLRIYGDLANR